MEEVIFEKRDKLGVITLNRPEALNALTLNMCRKIAGKLVDWEKDSTIHTVAIKGAGDRAFCAGGDVIMLHNSGKEGTNEAENFWRTEYALNELIYSYKKNYVSLINGITMGGGVGLSVHGKFRIAGPKTIFAMPETGIGYFPDVGGTYFLPRLHGALGNWLGLTGAKIDGAMALKFGIATHYFEGDNETILDLLTPGGNPDRVLRQIGTTPQAADIPELGLACFAKENVRDIISGLERTSNAWAKIQLAALLSKSPLSLSVTLRALKLGKAMSFREAMTHELIISLNHLKSKDFYEGIRAQLITKDRKPRWQYSSVGVIPVQVIDSFFQSDAARLVFIRR